MTKAPQRKRTFWKILFYTLVSLVAIVLLAIASLIFWLLTSRDPLDKFEVIAVEKAGSYGPYIATYRHYDSNHYITTFAIWIVNEPISIGSDRPPPLLIHPIAVWIQPSDVVSLQVRERLRLVIGNDVETQEGDLRPCYLSERTDKRICFDSKKVEAIPEAPVTGD